MREFVSRVRTTIRPFDESCDVEGRILLVRHPGPYPTESLYGYMLRLSEQNGYSSMFPMLKLAGMSQSEARTTGVRVVKIAKIANRRSEELEAIAHYNLSSPHHARLAGHEVLPTHLRRMKPAICPECVEEKGYVEAHWELLAMTGCPVHKQALLSSCSSCSKPLTWFRKGLLTCSCGSQLTSAKLPPIGQEEVELLDVIRRRVIGIPIIVENPSNFPKNDLCRMELYPLLSLIRVFGRQCRAARHTSEGNSADSDTKCASEVLAAWPHRLFDVMEQTLGDDTNTDFCRSALSRWYFPLFKSRAMPEAQVEFVKSIFIDFAAQRRGGTFDRKLIKIYGVDHPERYMTVSALAVRLNVHPKTAEGLIKGGTIPHVELEAAGVKRILVDSQEITIQPLLPGRVIREREAAAEVGIPVALLKALRVSGVYEVHATPISARGFHEIDVRKFIERIKAFATRDQDDAETEQCSTVRSALHELRYSIDAQVELIRSVIAGKMPLIDDGGDTVANFRIPGSEARLVDKMQDPWHTQTTTSREAGKRLGCPPECVQSLLTYGYLHGKQTPIGIRIPHESIEEFANTYIRLAAIAVTNGTSARALMKSCQVHNISMVIVASGRSKSAFVRREDAGQLVKQSKADRSDGLVGGGTRTNTVKVRERHAHPNELAAGNTISGSSLLQTNRPSASGTYSWKGASEAIGCNKECIYSLIEKGLLERKVTVLGTRITELSVAQFVKRYISMAELSLIEGTRPRKLERLCTANGISILTVRSRMLNHSFVHRKDHDIVLRALALSVG